MSGFARKREQLPFWKEKTLDQMAKAEWEQLCDGCGRCCLNKLEDADTGRIHHTDVVCRLLDEESCRCVSYEDRKRFVPECQILTPQNLRRYSWLPSTCAYRLLAEGQDLHWWHPLVSGDPDTVRTAGISVHGRIVPESRGDDPEDHIVEWPE